MTLPVDVVAMLATHPNIVGMKESGSDLKYVSALINSTPDDFVLLAGSAPVFYPSLLIGATGGVLALASVVPDLCVELYDLVQRLEYHNQKYQIGYQDFFFLFQSNQNFHSKEEVDSFLIFL